LFEDLIIVHPKPVAMFTIGNQPADVLMSEVPFATAWSDSSGVLSWYWSFGHQDSLGSSVEQNPWFTFPDQGPGQYPVTLTVTNVHGCDISLTQWVHIDGVTQLFIPNSFTPNGDGINDEFLLVHEGVDRERFEFIIFDRWGAVVFRTNDADAAWDGSNAEDGVYNWLMRYSPSYSTHNVERRGSIKLLR
jgi:gliding motility-associated-like protein